MPYCDKCGNSVAPSDKFCRQCGGLQPLASSSVDTSKMEPPLKSQANTTPTTKNNAPLPAVQPSRFRNCRACGNTITPGDKFCSKCLVLVKDPLPFEIPPDQLPPPSRQVFR